jgi:ribosomal protein L18E
MTHNPALIEVLTKLVAALTEQSHANRKAMEAARELLTLLEVLEAKPEVQS